MNLPLGMEVLRGIDQTFLYYQNGGTTTNYAMRQYQSYWCVNDGEIITN